MREFRWPANPPPPDPDLLEAIRGAAADAVPPDHRSELTIEVDPVGRVPVLRGRLSDWSMVVAAGHAAARRWADGQTVNPGDVVVDISTPDGADVGGPELGRPELAPPDASTPDGVRTASRSVAGDLPDAVDVVVIGAGISGLMVGYELIRTGARVAVVDAAARIAAGTTAWNNGMVHPGHDPRPGTAKALLNVQGNERWAQIAQEIGLPFHRRPSLVVGFGSADDAGLRRYAERARVNGVPGAELLSGADARRVEPRLSTAVSAALRTPSTASIDPVRAAQLLAVAIRKRGGTVTLTAPVHSIATEDGAVRGVRIGNRHITAPLVVNAAGVFADVLAATAGSRRYSIHPRRGTLILFDPGADETYPVSVGPVPGPYSKGGGMTARPDGSTTGGPTAVEQRSRIALPPTPAEIDGILELGSRIYPGFPMAAVVAVGSAVRAVTYSEDFVIGPAPGVPGLVDVAGTQSPAIAASPAIAQRVVATLHRLGHLPNHP